MSGKRECGFRLGNIVLGFGNIRIVLGFVDVDLV